ncbi:MAG TPA: hypothetical protein VMH05_19355 [Bryobacteraceae bacterium]|nr:hypothetical protein [Bryobacteraceae bacterium]
MRCTLMLLTTLGIYAVPAGAQEASQDLQIARTLVTELRELRQDLRNTAASIQRVQIVMYRLQAQATLVDKAAQRFDQARGECKAAEIQKTFTATQIERAEARKRNSQNASEQKAAEDLISGLQSSIQELAEQAQRCQVDQTDAENQLRTEQSKMSELESQLEKLDQSLAGFAGR